MSILLPAFDAESTLPACLASILAQRERRWECIVVDDGSRDATRACAERIAARDGRVRIIARPHRGLVAALNLGLAQCRADVVARMDADDVMHPDRLAAELAALEADPTLDAVGCHVRVFPRDRLRDGLRAYERWLGGIDSVERVRAEAFVECPVVHPTLAIRAAVLRASGYRDAPWPEDYDLLLRLLAAGRRVGMVPRPLLGWRDRPARLWRTDPRYGLDRLTACKAAFLARGLLASTDRYVLWGYGATGRALRRALLAHGKRPSHVVEVHPGRVGNTIHGAPVVSIDDLRRVPRRPVIASVAGTRPRGEIRTVLTAIGLREGGDFVCAA